MNIYKLVDTWCVCAHNMLNLIAIWNLTGFAKSKTFAIIVENWTICMRHFYFMIFANSDSAR